MAGGVVEVGEFDGRLDSIVVGVCDVVGAGVDVGTNEDALDIVGIASTGDHVVDSVDGETIGDVVSKGVDEGTKNWPNGDTVSIGDPEGTDNWPNGDTVGLSDGQLDT